MAARARIVICLMRNDLRYHDNEVLLWAHRNADHVLPLYCFDPRHYKGTYNFSFPKTGPHRAKFLLESLQDLRNTLKQHGSGLVVRSGEPEKILPQLVQQLGKDSVSAIAYQQEVTQEELDVEKGIQSNSGVKTHAIWGSTLVNKADLPFPVSQLPDVYTQFRKRVEQGCQIRPVLGMPDKLRPLPPGVEEGDMPTLESLGVESVEPDSRSAFPFSGGETTALDRVDHYYWRTDKVAKYKETRNGMIGADYSTKFSPWLAYGCISPRFIYAEKTRYEAERTANQSTYWVIFELLWRDYFRFVGLKYGTKLFCLEGIIGKNKPWRQDKKLFQAWKEGRTGVPYVDANMREMAATGFMSNRGRQNVASFLTKDLQLDWRLGAEWFESQLVDHDVCSNYGNWQYSAGIGNDPREDRKFNMVKQGLDYDADGQYVRLWVPELEGIKGGEAHIPWTLNSAVLSHAQVQLGETYPNPIVIAPEWSRHTKKGSARGRPGGRKEMPRQQRGMDFYFKGSGSKH